MSLIIVTGGTTGAADGTAVSESGRTAPLVFSALNTAVDAHMRRTADNYSADTSFTLPAELEVSFDGGTNYYGSGTNPNSVGADIGDLNVAIKLRQKTAATVAAGTFSTAGTDTACTALGTVAGFSATAGDASVALAWTATTNASGYIIEWGTSTSYGSTITIASGATVTYSHTGRTNGTALYYRIHAVGTGRYSDGGTATASATPNNNLIFFNDFESGESLNSTYLDSAVANSGIVNTTDIANRLSVKTTGFSDAAMWRLKAEIDRSAGIKRRFSFKFTADAGSSNCYWSMLSLVKNATIPTYCTSGTEATNWGAGVLAIDMQYASAAYYLRWYYYITSAGKPYATRGPNVGTYNTTNTTTSWEPYTLNSGQEYVMYFEWDDAGWAIELRNADGSAITNGRAPKIAWSATYPGAGATAVQASDKLWLCGGDKYTDNNANCVHRYKWIKLENIESVS